MQLAARDARRQTLPQAPPQDWPGLPPKQSGPASRAKPPSRPPLTTHFLPRKPKRLSFSCGVSSMEPTLEILRGGGGCCCWLLFIAAATGARPGLPTPPPASQLALARLGVRPRVPWRVAASSLSPRAIAATSGRRPEGAPRRTEDQLLRGSCERAERPESPAPCPLRAFRRSPDRH